MTPLELFEAGKKALLENRYEEAARLLELLVAGHPNNTAALLALTAAHRELGDWVKAGNYAGRTLQTLGTEAADELAFAAETLLIASSKFHGQADHLALYREIRPKLLSCIGRFSHDVLASHALGCVTLANDHEGATQIYRASFPNSSHFKLPARISPCNTLESWCATEKIEVLQIVSPLRVNVTCGNLAWSYHADAFRVAAIPGGEVLCGWDFAVTRNGHVLGNSGHIPIKISFGLGFPHMSADHLNKVVHLWPEQSSFVDEDVLFLSGALQLSPGHWIVDFLPRLRPEIFAMYPNLKIGIPSTLPEKQRRLLALAGIENDQLLECELGTRQCFRRLIVPMLSPGMRPHPENIAFLSTFMRDDRLEKEPNTRIFLCRSAPTRRIENWDQVKQLLDSFGFKFMCLENMSMDEQRGIIGAAALVVTTYGSDLLALFFMQPNADLVELRFDPHVDAVTGPMCALTGVNYHLLVGMRSEQTKIRRLKKDLDFVVDCERLAKILESAICQSSGDRQPNSQVSYHTENTSNMSGSQLSSFEFRT